MKYALFGGTFDPPHNGHLRLAREFAARLGWDRVVLMPTGTPPHKLTAQQASPADRLAMCRLAVNGDPLFDVSDREIVRGGASFTVDTLVALREDYPGVDWYLLTGADMFLTLGTWNRFDQLASMAVFCAAPRGDVTRERLEAYADTLRTRGARCVIEDIPAWEVSSTAVRQALVEGKPAGDWLCPAVSAYIASHGLYAVPAVATAAACDARFVDILRGRLTPARFAHTLAVAAQARALAPLYGADPDKAYTAGLLHDILKDASGDEQLQILRDFDILLDTAEAASPALWHARAGAVFIEHILGVHDPDVINAVRYHTTGRAGMSPLEKTVFVADFTSADRTYPDVDTMRRLAREGWQPAMLYALRYTIHHLVDTGRAIHPDAVDAYNEILSAAQAAPKGGVRDGRPSP